MTVSVATPRADVVQDYCDIAVSGRREGRPQLADTAPEKRVPAVMDFNFLLDMGRMTG
jgi:hypothetical protein